MHSATSKEISSVTNGVLFSSLIFVEATPQCRIPSSYDNSYHGAPPGVASLSADSAYYLSEPVRMNIVLYQLPLKC